MRNALNTTSTHLLTLFNAELEKARSSSGVKVKDLSYYFSYLVENQLDKDLKIPGDYENTVLEDETSSGILTRTSPKGLPYILALYGGDWEVGTYFCIYLDPKNKLRAYVPKAGNTYDLKTKAAYGHEDYEDPQLARWVKLGFDPDEYSPYALAEYDNRCEIDITAFETDIDNRILII